MCFLLPPSQDRLDLSGDAIRCYCSLELFIITHSKQSPLHNAKNYSINYIPCNHICSFHILLIMFCPLGMRTVLQPTESHYVKENDQFCVVLFVTTRGAPTTHEHHSPFSDKQSNQSLVQKYPAGMLFICHI